MSEPRALRLVIVTGAILIALAIVLLVVMPRDPVRANVPGFRGAVIGFELATRPEHVFGILGAPGDPARPDAVRAMNLANRIDFLFMLAYPAFFVAIACLLWARRLIPEALVLGICALAVVMAGSDALENRQLLVLSQLGDPAAMTPVLSRLRVWTTIKWTAIFATAVVLAPYAWRDRRGMRWSGLALGVSGVLGAAAVLRLPLLEAGANVLAVAWLLAWIHALRSRPSQA